MKVNPVSLFNCFLWLSIAINLNAETLTLSTNIAPPYQIEKAGELSGLSIDTLDCILKKIKQPYKIIIRPWLRSISEVQHGKSNGFFTSTQIKRMDSFATLSAPLFLERWYWYYANNPHTNKAEGVEKSVGVVRGSAQYQWLKSLNKYDIIEVNTQRQLVRLLEAGRVMAAVADKDNFQDEILNMGREIEIFPSKFIKYTPMGVYFSNYFLKNNSAFLANFNREIHHCIRGYRPLNDIEIEQLATLVSSVVSSIKSDSDLANYLKQENELARSIDTKKIGSLDSQWKKERIASNKPLINSIMSRPLSDRFRELKLSSNGLFTEIFLTNSKGMLIGASNITSDYWQGDEAKFKKTKGKRNGTVTYNDIVFDESSGVFQTQVGISIGDLSNNDYLGSLFIGINPEKALQAFPDTENNNLK